MQIKNRLVQMIIFVVQGQCEIISFCEINTAVSRYDESAEAFDMNVTHVTFKSLCY